MSLMQLYTSRWSKFQTTYSVIQSGVKQHPWPMREVHLQKVTPLTYSSGLPLCIVRVGADGAGIHAAALEASKTLLEIIIRPSTCIHNACPAGLTAPSGRNV